MNKWLHEHNLRKEIDWFVNREIPKLMRREIGLMREVVTCEIRNKGEHV